jgi:hypothetical protein
MTNVSMSDKTISSKSVLPKYEQKISKPLTMAEVIQINKELKLNNAYKLINHKQVKDEMIPNNNIEDSDTSFNSIDIKGMIL